MKLRRIDIYDQLGPAVIVNNSQDILVSDLYASVDGQKPLVLVDGMTSSYVADDDAQADPLTPSGHDGDGQRVRTFVRGGCIGRRTRTTADAVLSKLSAESSPDPLGFRSIQLQILCNKKSETKWLRLINLDLGQSNTLWK